MDDKYNGNRRTNTEIIILFPITSINSIVYLKTKDNLNPFRFLCTINLVFLI